MSWISVSAHDYGWQKQGGSPTLYNYGYPAFGSSQPNVVGQWIFSESSGAIVDQVSAISLAVVGTPTFSVAATGIYSGLSPGITYSNGNRHAKAGDDTHLDILTSNFTFEIWIKTTSVNNNIRLFSCDENVLNRGFFFYLNAGLGKIGFYLQAEDDTNVNSSITSSTFNDGNIHKIRYQGIRSGSISVFLDGQAQGSVDISLLSGKTIKCHNIIVSDSPTTGDAFAGTIYEARLSLNSTNISSGG